MSWDHRFTVHVLRSDQSEASGVHVQAFDVSGLFGDNDSGYTDSDGEVSFNIPTTLTGFPINVEIYADGGKIGSYTVSDGESITVTLDD